MKNLGLLVLTSLLLCTCNHGIPEGSVSATFRLSHRAGPALVKDFPCFGVLVTGPGIASKDTKTDGKVEEEPSRKDTYCTYPGAGSEFIAYPPTTGSEVVMTVAIPRGNDRLIQVVGLETLSGTLTCPKSQDVAQFLSSARSGKETKYGGLYEVGRAIADISTSGTEVRVEPNYESEGNLRTCEGRTENPDLVLSPSKLTLHPGGYYQFEAAGGVGTVTGVLYNSGGSAVSTLSVSGGKGNLQFPSTVGTYKLELKDSRNNLRKSVVTVKDPGGSPLLWYRADDFWNLGEVGTLSTEFWANEKPLAANLNPAGTIEFSRSSGPNGQPALTFDGSTSAKFSAGSLAMGTLTQLHVFVVGSTATPPVATDGVFCLAETTCGGTGFYGTVSSSGFGTNLDSGATPSVANVAAGVASSGEPFISYSNWEQNSVIGMDINAGGTLLDDFSSASAAGTTAFNPTIGTFEIGSNGAGFFDGKISEVLVYSSLNAAQLLEVTSYLRNKYAIDPD